MLKIENLHKKYDENQAYVLNNISIELPSTGLVFLLGKSGSGKTTLLNLLGAIDTPTSGEIYLNDKKYSALNNEERDELRNIDISFVFQDFNLLPDLNVIDNVMLPLHIQSESECDKESVDRYDYARKILDKVGLAEYEKRKSNQLSGGQIQRVAIARAMIKRPTVLLADEPTGNLDSYNGRVVFETLKKLSESCLVVVVTHDEESAYRYGNRVIKLVDGKVMSDTSLCDENIDIQYTIIKNDVEIVSDISGSQDVKNVITSEVQKCINEDGDADIRLDLKKIKKQKNVDKGDTLHRRDVKAKPFGYKQIVKFALSNMKNHKKHIVFTTIIMILTIMLIMLSALLSSYDSLEPIEKYLYEYEPDRFTAEISVEYTNSFFERQRNSLYTGAYYDSTLADVGLLDNRIKFIEEQYLEYNMHFFSYCNIYLLNGDYRICDDIQIAEGEVVITDYIARKMNIADDPVGKTLAIGDREYTVKACIDSVKDENIDSMFDLFDDNADMYESYYDRYYYNVVFLNESDFVTAKRAADKGLWLDSADFLNYQYERYYTRTSSVGSVGRFEGLELLCGDYPKNDNEIIISAEYAYENGYVLEDGQCSEEVFKQISYFKDIHSGFNHYFADRLDVSKFMQGPVRVVGIYASNQCQLDYLISDEVYKKMADEYYDKYYYTSSVLYLETDDYKDVLSHIEKYDSVLAEPAIWGIYDFEGLIEIIRDAVIFLLIVLTTIAVFMIYHNISISISYNKKNIGVLRSIGVSKRCTMKIFMIEALFICTLSSILSTIAGVIVMNVVNGNNKAEIMINPYDILVWDWPLSLAVVLVAFVVFTLTAVVPIMKYGKKTPIEVIRGN